ncbi:TPA: hypothetical protein EYP66_06930 [Candidatus Poribacteria bacterium]|nr:hypothetical protein [Candidatus Poribacteria bacterium]
MRWNYLTFAGVIFLTSTLVGCSIYNALFKELPLSENYALRSMGSNSNTPWVIDGDRDYGEKTKPLPVIYKDKSLEDDYTGVDVILREPKQIDEIKIYSDKDRILDHCEIWAHVPGGAEDEWKVVKEIKRNISPLLIIHPRKGVYTDQIRVMIRRTRPTSGGTSSGGGGRDGEPFIDINPIIKEVELYKILKEKEQPKEEKK